MSAHTRERLLMPPPDGVDFNLETNTSHLEHQRIKRIVRGLVNRSPGDNSLRNFLFLRGAPSVGKTYPVEEALEECKCDVETTLPTASTAPELMREFGTEPRRVLFWDDQDRALSPAMVGIIKNATEVGKKRTVSFRLMKSAYSRASVKARARAERDEDFDFEDDLAPAPFEFAGTIIMISNIVPDPGMPLNQVWRRYPRVLQPHIEALTARAVNIWARPTFEDQYHHACWSIANRDGVLRIKEVEKNRLDSRFKITPPEIWEQVLKHAADHVWKYAANGTAISIRDIVTWRSDVMQFEGIDIPTLPSSATWEMEEIYHRPSLGLWTFEP